MSKKNLFVLVGIYLFLYILNYLTPLGFGDDYLYSFVWQGKPMFVPLSEDAVRVSSLHDLFISQLSIYQTWSGRIVDHTIAQIFLWAGKDIFNFFNAFVGLILVLEIYWCMHKGEVSFSNLKPAWLFWIFFALWAFSPAFVTVFLWLEGACNYLWTGVLLLGFSIPYIRKYYYEQEIIEIRLFNVIMFFWGIGAAWTNENSICWIIFLLSAFLFTYRKKGIVESWMYTGLLGLIIGYMLLMMAPGNMARFHSVHGTQWLSSHKFSKNLFSFFIIVCNHQLFMWYFVLRSLLKLKNESSQNQTMKKEIRLICVFSLIALGMSAIMLLSPEFPGRSGFPGTIWLIIATGIMFRLQTEYGVDLLRTKVKKFLTGLGVLYFIVTSAATLNNYHRMHEYVQELVLLAQKAKNENSNEILLVKPFEEASKVEEFVSGFHIIINGLTEDENRWENVAFSRYYGIKGIRVVKEKEENK